MLKQKRQGPVTVFKMGRSLGPWVPYWVHAFLIEDLLIDSGTSAAGRELIAALREKRIRTLVNTHHHEDHIGNNHLVQESLGAEILAHARALPYLQRPQRIEMHWYQHVVWKRPLPSRGHPLPNELNAGPYRFTVIPTPGHAPDHVCLYEEREGWLFSGDLFCGSKVKYLRADEDYNVLLTTLRTLAGLQRVKTLFCSLFGVVGDGREALQRKVRFMEALRGEVLVLYRQGVPPAEIRARLLGSEGAMFYITGGHYAKRNVINSILKPHNHHGKFL